MLRNLLIAEAEFVLAKPAALRHGQHVDAEADSKKRMIDCSEMARAISKLGSGLRAIAANTYVFMHVCCCDCGVNQGGVRSYCLLRHISSRVHKSDVV